MTNCPSRQVQLCHASYLFEPLEGSVVIGITLKTFKNSSNWKRKLCMKWGLLLNLPYIKWFDETIWYDRRHHMIIIGFCCYWQSSSRREFLRFCACGSWGWLVTSGCKTTVCYLGRKPFLLTIPSQCLLHISICKVWACWKFSMWITFPFLQVVIMTTTEVDALLNKSLKEFSSHLRCRSSCLSSGPWQAYGDYCLCAFFHRKIKVLEVSSLPHVWLWNRSCIRDWILSNSKLIEWFAMLNMTSQECDLPPLALCPPCCS